MQLFLDCDGVLADFERGAADLLGVPAAAYQAKYGPGGFWKRLATAPEFYTRLQLMPDALELYEAVRHVDPIILTGLPIGKWAEPQKRAWAEAHFPGVQVITTLARHKSQYCTPGDVLVDDNDKYRNVWEEAGGVFVMHTSAAASLAEL
ncbi:MAG TPA: hypothetical protein VHL57_09970, partial [Flavobacteriales bacterium]|nr:hypothetical protein [Flavobacteriales bacterium]